MTDPDDRGLEQRRSQFLISTDGPVHGQHCGKYYPQTLRNRNDRNLIGKSVTETDQHTPQRDCFRPINPHNRYMRDATLSRATVNRWRFGWGG
jgi:hypothetical protein